MRQKDWPKSDQKITAVPSLMDGGVLQQVPSSRQHPSSDADTGTSTRHDYIQGLEFPTTEMSGSAEPIQFKSPAELQTRCKPTVGWKMGISSKTVNKHRASRLMAPSKGVPHRGGGADVCARQVTLQHSTNLPTYLRIGGLVTGRSCRARNQTVTQRRGREDEMVGMDRDGI